MRAKAGRHWSAKAECANVDPDMFFDIGKDKRKIAAARAVCFRCPVRRQCLRDNLEVVVGFFGGMTELERWKARRMPGRPNTNANLAFFGIERVDAR